MKKLIVIPFLFVTLFVSSHSVFADGGAGGTVLGGGGISGGTGVSIVAPVTDGRVVGGHIEFQQVSTFVSPVFNKSLCFDGKYFHANVKVCTLSRHTDRADECLASEKVRAIQPMESTRDLCVSYAKDRSGERGDCQKWSTVPYVQSPVRTINVEKNDEVVRTLEYRVPDCN